MKKFLLCVMAFFLIVSVSYSMEAGQTATMKKGAQAVQKFNNPLMPYRGVVVPNDQVVTVIGAIDPSDLAKLEIHMPPEMWNEDWKTAFLVEFDHDFGAAQQAGVQKLKILIRQADLK